MNIYDPTGRTYRITTQPEDGHGLPPNSVRVKTYRQILTEYRTHPEAKFNGPDGQPCTGTIRGVLTRRTIQTTTRHLIGKEANHIGRTEAGLVGDLDDILTDYPDPAEGTLLTTVLPLLGHLSSREIAVRTGISKTTVNNIRKGAQPRPKHRSALTDLASQLYAPGI